MKEKKGGNTREGKKEEKKGIGKRGNTWRGKKNGRRFMISRLREEEGREVVSDARPRSHVSTHVYAHA
ncbi:hypothetical protein, partial [Staphylococcus aureus]